VAKKLYPEGIDIPGDFNANIKATKTLLDQRKPLFEAGIKSGNIYSRIDILVPSGNDEWDIIEVKSATGVKDLYLDEVSFEKYCCETSGLKINKCFVAYVNNAYVKHGEIKV